MTGQAVEQGQGPITTGAPIAVVATLLAPEAITARLLKLSKRGKLAGFAARRDGPLFETEAHGLGFDFQLVAFHEAAAVPGAGQVRFELRPLWKLPLCIIAVTILAAGPGLWLTHSMMLTYFSWYKLSLLWTAAWYEPFTIVPVPWIMRRAWTKSRVAATEHARETIARIAAELGGA